MTTRKQKQVAYNERVSQAEDEISGINCDIADFCQDSMRPNLSQLPLMPENR
jgi:hypothetical protein